MEYVNAILYHKIQDSDFTNMYGVKKPTTGGGQTYIQAAGYVQAELDAMFDSADIITNTIEYWDDEKKLPRKNYVFQAIAIGSDLSAEIELAPRIGRKDYRICRQNMKYRHPAWSPSQGFPEPQKDASATASDCIFKYQKDYPGIIDNLYIFILKTTTDTNDCRYYASFINAPNIPEKWPLGVGLEQIFRKQSRQGILFFDDQYIRFENSKDCPFASGCAADSDIENAALPNDLSVIEDDAVEFAKKAIKMDIDYNNLSFQQIEVPTIKRKPKSASSSRTSKDNDFGRRNKNKKTIGDIGENIVMVLERERLVKLGRPDLAAQIEHVSKTKGDGLGYDIISFDNFDDTFEKIYIEVKTTTGNKNKPFDISLNEVEVSEELSDHFCIYRLFNIHQNITSVPYYVLRGAVKDNFLLEPTNFRAYPKGNIQ